MTRTLDQMVADQRRGEARQRRAPGAILRRIYRTVFHRGYSEAGEEDVEVRSMEAANVISSRIHNSELHAPVLDLDMHAELVPSSTPGHFHLYIDKAMTWEQYQKLMDVMAEVGLLEPGYVQASKKRGASFVRLPWVKKPREWTPPTYGSTY